MAFLMCVCVVCGSRPCVDYPLIQTLTDAQVASPLAWSKDSTLVAFITESMTKVWDVFDWNLTSLTTHAHFVNAIAWSRSGLLATVTSDSLIINIINSTTGAPFAVLVGHNISVNGLTFSPDSKWIASGSTNGVIRIWNASTTAENVNTFQVSAKAIYSLSWSVQGRGQNLTTSENKRGGGELERRAGGRQEKGEVLGQLVVGSTEKVIQVFDPMTGTELHSMNVSDTTAQVVWSGNGQKVAYVLNSGSVFIWDSVTNSTLALNSSEKMLSLDWSPEDRFVVCGSLAGPLSIWDAVTGVHYRDFPGPHLAFPPLASVDVSTCTYA